MILVAGSANLDFVVRAAHIPAPGETVLGRDFRSFPGGKGANQAVACARAGGVATQMLLALGNDVHAQPVEASLRSAGVVLHTVRSSAHPTGTAFICLADDAENAITVAPGANLALRPEHLPDLAGVVYLLMQLETPVDTVTAYAQQARRAGVRVVLNAAPAQALPAALLAALDVLVVNEGELAVVSGNAGQAGGNGRDTDRTMQALGVPTVVVTLGADGCRALHGGAFVHQPAFAVQAVDTTAAGDTFCGTLVAAMSRGEAFPAALRFASAAAALACTVLGAQTSIPARADVLSFLQGNPHPTPEDG